MWKDKPAIPNNELEKSEKTIIMVDFDNNVMKYEGVSGWALLTDVWMKLQDEEEVKLINLATIKEITIE